MEGYTEVKVVSYYNDEKRFEEMVNGYCCNNGYKIISCKVAVVVSENIMYVAFLGK